MRNKKLRLVIGFSFIRLRLNTLQLAAGMKGKVNRAEARQSVGGLGYGATCRAEAIESEGRFRFDTPQLAAGSFINIVDCLMSIRLSFNKRR